MSTPTTEAPSAPRAPHGGPASSAHDNEVPEEQRRAWPHNTLAELCRHAVDTEIRLETTVYQAHDDADDTVGTVGTDDAIGFDPFPLLRALSSDRTGAVVMGPRPRRVVRSVT